MRPWLLATWCSPPCLRLDGTQTSARLAGSGPRSELSREAQLLSWASRRRRTSQVDISLSST